jgi:type IV pilus assembly protein PilA
VTGALAEISAGKLGVEHRIMEGASELKLADIGLKETSSRCKKIEVTLSDAKAGTAELVCTISGKSDVEGSTIRLTRESPGDEQIVSWTCKTDVPAKLTPASCENTTGSNP